MSPAKRRGLGRGLDALLTQAPKAEDNVDNDSQDVAAAPEKGELRKLPIEQLQPGKYQPRKDMSPDALEELSSSIKAQGIIQPIVVRSIGDHQYEIIAGERRWRAAQLAELAEVPCLVKDVADEAAVAIALIENIQREDLNAMEEAIALERLLTEFELTHQEVAEAVGKSRTTVTNLLRLNNLNDEVKTLLEHGDIEMGHARALLALEGDVQNTTARTVVAKELTVRETEALIKKVQEPPIEKAPKQPDPNTVSLEQQLAERLGSQVSISHNKKGKGKLVISYTNLEELDGILAKIH
ncbi:ParB/RepB/Spo0J family partition protein [Thalassotalea euphylliae]|uniref:Probable chromosome-partitioning protein ParB n=1 Tax=Thalassotalea euphylliae TaxID=1655234 RepID=A0A3E0TWI9_9GAMM|nr:ParB/RepB/Spo0J family partition protein [Thalassotalea euphylliae]REL28737.1 ParB/RepB/Spo0J family partition protein [Thalassotalea euphylliae]